MDRWSLPDVEFRDVPADLLGPAHGILMAITGYMKLIQPIAPDESFGGYMTGREQPVSHYGMLRRVSNPDPDHENVMRVVDLDEPATAGFPYRLFAAHLIALADRAKNPQRREALFRRATEIYPGSKGENPEDISQTQTNPNNFVGWHGLGVALGELGRTDEAIAAFEQAIIRWPFGASDFSNYVRERVQAGQWPNAANDPVAAFWSTVDIPGIVEKHETNR